MISIADSTGARHPKSHPECMNFCCCFKELEGIFNGQIGAAENAVSRPGFTDCTSRRLALNWHPLLPPPEL
jgi:hypothetical protein